MAQLSRTLQKIFRLCHLYCGSGIKYGDPVSNMKGQVNVMGDEHHCLSLVRKLAEYFKRFQSHFQIQARCGFVRDDQGGVAYDSR